MGVGESMDLLGQLYVIHRIGYEGMLFDGQEPSPGNLRSTFLQVLAYHMRPFFLGKESGEQRPIYKLHFSCGVQLMVDSHHS